MANPVTTGRNLIDAVNDAIEFLDTCQKHDAVAALDTLVDEYNAARALIARMRDAIRELHDGTGEDGDHCKFCTLAEYT